VTDDENFFLHCVDDLRRKVEAATRYELLRAMGICRQLLLDERPLVHIVNKPIDFPFCFNTVALNASLRHSREK